MPAFIGDFSCRRRLPATPPGGKVRWGVRQRDEGETPRQCARTCSSCLAGRARRLTLPRGFSMLRRRSHRIVPAPLAPTSVIDNGGFMVRGIVRMLSGVLLAWIPWAAATAQAGSIRGTVSDSAGNPLGNASISVEAVSYTH